MQFDADGGGRFFFATAPVPCPYLPGRMERRLVAELSGDTAAQFHDVLSQAGFRRSHRFAYVPVCRECSACATVRIVAGAMRRTRTQRKIWKRNVDLTAVEIPPRATQEQFALFNAYQETRHVGGEMARMDFFDFRALVEDTPIETRVVEFRNDCGKLVAACITDRVRDGVSAVYSYFDSQDPQRSLGTFMILWLVERTLELGLEHVYLGFWIAGCSKMAYKADFQPLEAYTADGWRPLHPNDPQTILPFKPCD